MSTDLVWLYLLERDDGLLYVGIAMDVPTRLQQHRSGHGARFTRNHTVQFLGALPVGTRAQAARLERRVKRWAPVRKRRLFEGQQFSVAEDDAAIARGMTPAWQNVQNLERELLEARQCVTEITFQYAPHLYAFLCAMGMPLSTIIYWLCHPSPGYIDPPAQTIAAGATTELLAAAVRARFDLDLLHSNE